MKKRYIKAEVYGMCGGVFSALGKLDELIRMSGGREIYVLHELVHNKLVTAEYETRGVCFVDSVEMIPAGSIAVIGAHGVDVATENSLRARAETVVDATCPLVKKLQNIAAGLSADRELLIFGKAGHPEVAGVAGHSNAGKTIIISSEKDIAALPELKKPCFISQTTVDASLSDRALQQLKERFPGLEYSSGVCDASRKRQAAVSELAKVCPVVIVAGSAHSSNACRLAEIASAGGATAFRIDDASELPEELLAKTDLVGVTSGASTPEATVEKIIIRLQELGFSA